jgi:tetratricopeptide (TPR) repeat protein
LSAVARPAAPVAMYEAPRPGRRLASAAAVAAAGLALGTAYLGQQPPVEPAPARMSLSEVQRATERTPLRTEFFIGRVAVPESAGTSGAATAESRMRDDVAYFLTRVPRMGVVRDPAQQIPAYSDGGREVRPHPYLVDIEAREDNGRQRFTYSLADAESGGKLVNGEFWIGGLDGHPDAREVALAITRRVHVAVVADRARKAQPDGSASAAVQRGWGYVGRIARGEGAEGAREAVALFSAVHRDDPGHSSAMIGHAAALVYQVESLTTPTPAETLAEVRRLSERALLIDNYASLPIFYLGIADILSGDSGGAIAHFRRQIERSPSHSHSYAYLGLALSRAGRPAEGLEEARRAIRISPRETFIGHKRLFLGEILLALGRDEEALESFRLARQIMPRSGPVYLALAATHALRGDEAATREAVMLFRTLGLPLGEETSLDLATGRAAGRLAEGARRALGLAPPSRR